MICVKYSAGIWTISIGLMVLVTAILAVILNMEPVNIIMSDKSVSWVVHIIVIISSTQWG